MTPKAREREAFAIERKAANDELRKVWLVQVAERRQCKKHFMKRVDLLTPPLPPSRRTKGRVCGPHHLILLF